MDRTWALAGAVVLVALIAGCSGGGDGGSNDATWCDTGTIEAVASQQAGDSVTVEGQGMVERDDRDVCQISYEIEDESSQFAGMDAFFDQSQEYVEFVYYDENGDVFYEADVSDDA